MFKEGMRIYFPFQIVLFYYNKTYHGWNDATNASVNVVLLCALSLFISVDIMKEKENDKKHCTWHKGVSITNWSISYEENRAWKKLSWKRNVKMVFLSLVRLFLILEEVWMYFRWTKEVTIIVSKRSISRNKAFSSIEHVATLVKPKAKFTKNPTNMLLNCSLSMYVPTNNAFGLLCVFLREKKSRLWHFLRYFILRFTSSKYDCICYFIPSQSIAIARSMHIAHAFIKWTDNIVSRRKETMSKRQKLQENVHISRIKFKIAVVQISSIFRNGISQATHRTKSCKWYF